MIKKNQELNGREETVIVDLNKEDISIWVINHGNEGPQVMLKNFEPIPTKIRIAEEREKDLQADVVIRIKDSKAAEHLMLALKRAIDMINE